MNSFYSSLIINGKKFPNVYQVFKPRYNKEYFKRISGNIEQLEKLFEVRCRGSKTNTYSIKNLQNDSRELVKLKIALEKMEKDENGDTNHDTKLASIKDQLEEIEDRLMPFVITLPNRASKQVPDQEVILDQVESDFKSRERLSKTLSHTKLSFINNCYSKSVVGPNSHYYFGIGAKLQYGLDEFFTSRLEQENFIPVSGLCLAKSAVVEATNSKDSKEYPRDPCRVLTDDHKYTTQHLVEASRESLVGFVTTLGHRPSNDPLRLMCSGASYRLGVDWFDSDDHKVAQFQTIHALSQSPSIEQYSMKEYHQVKDVIWNSYKILGLPTRLIHCPLEKMFANEYDAHRIDVWLPSRQEWIQTGRVSHYLDLITVRSGMKRGHIIDSTVYDGQALTAAIIENNQTSTGKFIIPNALMDHMLDLSRSEKELYFSEPTTTDYGKLPTNYPLYNYEQRRYLVRKSYALSHSKRAYKMKNQGFRFWFFFGLSFFGFTAMLLDWEEIWIIFAPNWFKAFSYDYLYRPVRKIWWAIIFKGNANKPKDLPYADLDLSHYDMTMFERKRKFFFRKEFSDSNDNGSLDTK